MNGCSPGRISHFDLERIGNVPVIIVAGLKFEVEKTVVYREGRKSFLWRHSDGWLFVIDNKEMEVNGISLVSTVILGIEDKSVFST